MEAKRSLVVGNIQVSGAQCFDGSRWREAILYYLFGMWKNDTAVTHRPKIAFGDIMLRLIGDSYVLYGISTDDSARAPIVDGKMVITNGEQNDVEVGLARFVKDNSIRQLAISLGDGGSLILSKGESRGELLAWATCLATNAEVTERYYH